MYTKIGMMPQSADERTEPMHSQNPFLDIDTKIESADSGRVAGDLGGAPALFATLRERGLVNVTTSIGKSLLGRLQPQVHLFFPVGSDIRVMRAVLHRLAAEVELTTPAEEAWDVQFVTHHSMSRLFLLLKQDNLLEAEQGLACLRRVVGDEGNGQRTRGARGDR